MTVQSLVVFDLDGVIARTDTMAYLLQRQLVSHPLRAVAGAVPAALWFLLRRYPRARPALSRALGRAALSGLSLDEYRDIAEEVGALLGSDPTRSIQQGLVAIRKHVESGDEVVVTTGTEAILARRFLDSLGLGDVELVGTEIRFGRWLAHYDNHNLGGGKVSAFESRAIDLFYTDSDLDLPVARRSKRTILVNPNEHIARRFRSEMADVQVVRWS